MIDLKDYPNELVDGRQMAEGLFLATLLQQPDLFDDYRGLTEGKRPFLRTPDGQLYYNMGVLMYQQGYRNFNNAAVYDFLDDKPDLKKIFDDKGGFTAFRELLGLAHPSNLETDYDKIARFNILMDLYDKGFNVLKDIRKFSEMTSQQIYDYYDYLLNSVSLTQTANAEVEELRIDMDFLKECDNGMEMGLSYGANCPLLNYCTLGVPLGELFMFGGFSGTGKTSFIFENMLLPMTMDGVKCVVISNEQRSKDYKQLLLAHILIHDLHYEGLSRKRLKQGKFSEEQWSYLRQAEKIADTKYSGIQFVKLFDSDMSKVKRFVRKFAKMGYQVFMYDTMKSEDKITESMWQQLLIQSRQLFQLASKEQVAIICTYQLALHCLNKRFLDASCLSNAKQIKEVFSEMIYTRLLWDDEFPGQKYDVKPYRYEVDADKRYTGVKTEVQIDPDHRYLIMFVDKTRNGADKIQILYEFDGKHNHWTEIGYCKVPDIKT